MNARKAITTLCAINIALIIIAGWIWRLYQDEKNKPPTVETKVITNTVRRVVLRNPDTILTNQAPLFRRWSDLESSQYPVYIVNLRAFGCPEETIRDIIIGDVERLYKNKRKELLSKWKPTYWNRKAPPEIVAQFKKLELEQKALIKDLLGIDIEVADNYELVRLESEKNLWVDFLPESKQNLVKEIHQKYEQLKDNVYKKAGGVILKKDIDEINRLEQAYDKELAEVLTSTELEEFKFRNSEVVADMVDWLSSKINVTEEEFRQICKIEMEYRNKFYSITDSDPIDALIAERDKKVRQILGEERYKEYVRQNDTDYQNLLEFNERFELPKEKIDKVYEFKTALRDELRRVQNDDTLTVNQKSNAVTLLWIEGDRTLKQILGNDVYDAYLEYDSDYVKMFESIIEDISRPPQEQQPQQPSSPDTNMPPRWVPLVPWWLPPPPPGGFQPQKQ